MQRIIFTGIYLDLYTGFTQSLSPADGLQNNETSTSFMAPDLMCYKQIIGQSISTRVILNIGELLYSETLHFVLFLRINLI